MSVYNFIAVRVRYKRHEYKPSKHGQCTASPRNRIGPHRVGDIRKREYYRRTQIKKVKNRGFHCHLSPDWPQMTIEYTVFI